MERGTKSQGTRMFRSVITILLFVLTLSVVAFARSSTSYMLTIQKILDPDMDPSALQAAQKATYHFRVTDKATGQAILDDVKITGEGEETIKVDSSGSREVVITELTGLTSIPGYTTKVKSIESVLLPSNGVITFVYHNDGMTLEHPKDAGANGTYHIYKGEFATGTPVVSKEIKPGEAWELKGDALQADTKYTIQGERAGFTVQVTRESFDKKDGGTFRIFGKANVSFTAPDSPGMTYHYHLERDGDTVEHFELAPGQTEKRELNAGEYVLRKVAMQEGSPNFDATVPVAKKLEPDGSGTVPNSGGSVSITGCAYGANLTVGALIPTAGSGSEDENSASQEPGPEDEETGSEAEFQASDAKVGDDTAASYDLVCKAVLLMVDGTTQEATATLSGLAPGDSHVIGFQNFAGVDSSKVSGLAPGTVEITITGAASGSFPITWEAYEVSEEKKNYYALSEDRILPVSHTGKVVVSKPALAGDDHAYIFTITDERGNEIQDANGSPVTAFSLKQGEQKEFTLLAGEYKIRESFDGELPAAASTKVQITDTISNTDAGSVPFRLNGPGDKITLTKNGALTSYMIYGAADTRKVAVESGNTVEVTGLAAGDYTIRGLGEYYVTCRSGTGNSITVTSGAHVAVRFTNTITPGTETPPPPPPVTTPTPAPSRTPSPTPSLTPAPTPPAGSQGAYRVVHQYYLRTYEGIFFEGASEIETIPAPLELDKDPADRTRYDADGVELEEVFVPQFYHPDYSGEEGEPQVYTHHSDRYGHMLDGTSYQVDRSMDSVLSTEDGSQIIILRYVRGDEEEIEIPDDPIPFPSAHPDPTPTPNPSPTPNPTAKPTPTPKPTSTPKPTATPKPKSVPKTGAGVPVSFWLTLNASSLAGLGAVRYAAMPSKKRTGKKGKHYKR